MPVEKEGFVYMMSNDRNTVLYTGVTSDLEERIYQHKTNFYPRSFTARYNIHKLVYFEEYSDIQDAIEREKQIKGYSRKNKNKLINSCNPEWKDLSVEIGL